MRYFGTAFSLTLAGLRLRVRIELEDEPDERVATHHLKIPVRKSEASAR